MRKKMSYDTVATQSAYHEKQHTLYMLALQAMMRGDARLVCAHHDADGGYYEYRACGETRADGGLVLVTFITAGQNADTRVMYIEEEYQHARDHAYATADTTRHYEAMSRVVRHRDTALVEMTA